VNGRRELEPYTGAVRSGEWLSVYKSDLNMFELWVLAKSPSCRETKDSAADDQDGADIFGLWRYHCFDRGRKKKAIRDWKTRYLGKADKRNIRRK
jgi:hypothetical protein